MKSYIRLLSVFTILVLTTSSMVQGQSFIEHLTFYSSFDSDKADFAKGDLNIYTSISRKEADNAKAGLHNPDVSLATNKGKYGNALEFRKKSKMLTFFKSQKNIAFEQSKWSGTISFWLQIDPENDLEPGYCDPIQITDVSYNDASIWVDFTKDNPRKFRLGVLGDLNVWNPDNLSPDDNPDFENRLVIMNQHPFSRKTWTQITITYNNLGQPDGMAKLYVNGVLQGTKDKINVPFTWELSKSRIMLGLSYIGLMDELAIFNAPLSTEEVSQLYKLKNGLKPLL